MAKAYKILIPFAFLLSLTGFEMTAQQDSTWLAKPDVFISAFADVFYIYDAGLPQSSQRQTFLYNHNRHNEFNLNLAYIQCGLRHHKYRAQLTLQSGTYAADNYAVEPGVLRHIFEGYAGLSLNKKNNLWLDAGILPSHMGFESASSMDNATLTRSLVAENSPYFLSGVRLTYTPGEKWEMAGLMINGWQRIQRVPGNSLPSFGTQILYRPSEKIALNWSTFAGTDDPDSTRRMRYFHNFYGKFQISDHIMFITGFDAGIQQTERSSSQYHMWFGPVFIGQYAFSKILKTAVRTEFYQDKNGVIIPRESPSGFQTTGLSINLDYTPAPYIMCRVETRWMSSADMIFQKRNSPSHQNFIVGASIAVRFPDMSLF